MKYNIMHDYGSDGFCFYKHDRETTPKDFDTVGEAIMCAISIGFGSNFIIVSVVDYKKLVLEIDLINPTSV